MSKAAADSARTAERAAEKAAREAAKAANKAQREIIDTQREAIEAGKGLAELAGIPADKFEKLRAVMSGLSSPLGQLAVAGVGAALAIGGVATAIAGVSAAAVASVRASGELLEKFEKLSEVEGFDIPPEDVESIRRANAALDSIQVTAERLVVIFAGQMAPRTGGRGCPGRDGVGRGPRWKHLREAGPDGGYRNRPRYRGAPRDGVRIGQHRQGGRVR
jgi:hypothetical protein